MDNLAQKIQFPEIIDQRGSLSFLESKNHIPFNIKCTSVIRDFNNLKNGEYLIKNHDELLVALCGIIIISTKNGKIEETFKLNKPNFGLYIPRTLKRNFIKYSPNAILLVLKSD